MDLQFWVQPSMWAQYDGAKKVLFVQKGEHWSNLWKSGNQNQEPGSRRNHLKARTHWAKILDAIRLQHGWIPTGAVLPTRALSGLGDYLHQIEIGPRCEERRYRYP